jgi:hypothetical protein
MDIAGHPYPAEIQVDSPDQIARWRPLVQWFLAIPHFLVLWALGTVSQVVGIISWFAVVITGRLPAGLAGLQAMYLRYYNRVYVYSGFILEGYPPFSFNPVDHDPGDYDRERVDLEPKLEERNRLTAAFRLILVIPQFVVLFFLGIAAAVVHFVAFFAVIITGRWPEGMQRFVVGVLRWSLRVDAYFLLLTDEYPPFSLD